jgi:histidinol-phosphate aminotransferase
MLNRRNWLKANTALLGSLMLHSLDVQAAPDAKSDMTALPHQSGNPLIRIGQNENPYGPSPKALEAIMQFGKEGNRYASRLIEQLRGSIALKHGVKPDNILLGCGSSEILGLGALMVSMKKGHIIMADPTFKVWVGMAETVGLTINRINLDAQMRQDLNRMAESVNDQTRLIYLCNPNNPTGTVNPTEELTAFVKRFAPQYPIMLDEAYTEYADAPSLTPLINDYPNLIVAKTFSKVYGMAGMRVGYAIAHADTIKKLGKFQPWMNAGVSNVSAAVALAALQDEGFVKLSKQKNAETLAFTTDFLQSKGFDVVPSKTNFLFFNVHHLKIDVAAEMLKHNVTVRNWEAGGKKFCRVSMGTMEDMQVFKETFSKVIA